MYYIEGSYSIYCTVQYARALYTLTVQYSTVIIIIEKGSVSVAMQFVLFAALLGSCLAAGLAVAPHKREVRNPLHAHLHHGRDHRADGVQGNIHGHA